MNYIAQSPVASLCDLTHFSCRFPIGDPLDEGFGFCGATKKIGSSYCERHHRLAYTTCRQPDDGRAPHQVAHAWTDRRETRFDQVPITVWRPKWFAEPEVVLPSVTLEGLVKEHKERRAREVAAAVPVDPPPRTEPKFKPSKQRDLRKEFEEYAARWEIEESKRKAREAEAASISAIQEGRAVRRPFFINHIIRVVANHYLVSPLDIISARRTATVVRPRQVAMYLAKTLTLNSLPEVGRRFGGRDHTTVLHAVRKIGALIEVDPILRAEIEELRMALSASEATGQ